ncbi:MAG: transposase [Acetobacteraceae bacterium]
MSRYRRTHSAGSCYFFTVVTYRRRPILCDDTVRHALREAILLVRGNRPFSIDAWVLLPDHLHCIWTLPPGDADYSMRWNMIKRRVSIICSQGYKHTERSTPSRRKHRESTVWQRRFWERQIRDEMDFMRHADYIHYNPVKHGLCSHVSEWPYSTFHRYAGRGIYSEDWGGVGGDIDLGTAGE